MAGGDKNIGNPPVARSNLTQIVDVNELQRKQDQESEKCSKEVVMDVKELVDLGWDPDLFGEADFQELDAGGEIRAIGGMLTCIDQEMNIEHDLLSANVIEGHKEKPYLIKLKSKQAASRLLAAARASKVEFKSLRPSLTRMEREKYRLERERRQKEGGGNERKERNEGNGKKTRNNNVLYFNPKPGKSNEHM